MEEEEEEEEEGEEDLLLTPQHTQFFPSHPFLISFSWNWHLERHFPPFLLHFLFLQHSGGGGEARLVEEREEREGR